MKITRISPSLLQLYSDCPRCFYLSTEKRYQQTTAAMQFGSRLHKAIEQYHTDGLYYFDDDLQQYMDIYMQEYDRVFQVTEEKWTLPLFNTDITLSMKVDLVKDDFLIEHKTSSRAYSQEFVDKHRQITAYSWAWSRIYTEREKGIRFNVFLTNPKDDESLLQVLETSRTKADFSEWEDWVKEILSGIDNDQFEPKEARWHNYDDCPLYKERG